MRMSSITRSNASVLRKVEKKYKKEYFTTPDVSATLEMDLRKCMGLARTFTNNGIWKKVGKTSGKINYQVNTYRFTHDALSVLERFPEWQ